jgi:hypothetical protein
VTVAGTAPTTAPTSVSTTQFREEGSTTVTTVLAGVLAVITWGTFGLLIASYLGAI